MLHFDGFTLPDSPKPITVSFALEQGGKSGGVSTKRLHSEMSAGGARAIETEEGSKLFVGRLPFSKTETDLRQLFSQFGHVAEVALLYDGKGEKKGAAFVKFMTAAAAESACSLDGYVFDGSPRAI